MKFYGKVLATGWNIWAASGSHVVNTNNIKGADAMLSPH